MHLTLPPGQQLIPVKFPPKCPRGSGLSCQSQRRPGGFHILPWGNQGEDSWLLDHQTWGSRWALRGLGSTHWPLVSPGVSNPPRAVISPCPSLLPVVEGWGDASVLPSLGGSFLIPPHKGASDENAAFPCGRVWGAQLHVPFTDPASSSHPQPIKNPSLKCTLGVDTMRNLQRTCMPHPENGSLDLSPSS